MNSGQKDLNQVLINDPKRKKIGTIPKRTFPRFGTYK